MKLNPAKCSFKVSSGKFIEYLITKRGIEADPNQIRAVRDLQPSKNVKDVHKLTGRLAALSRFISKYSERSKPIFQTLGKGKAFDWSDEYQSSFESLKEYLSSPPLLEKPEFGEPLLLYLVVSSTAISAILVRERQGKQHPIYYASKALLDAETRYGQLQKLAFALTMASRKLRSYFQSHPITVVTTFPLKVILSKPDISGRLAKWAVEFAEYGPEFQPRMAIKSQVLADFIAYFTYELQVEAERELYSLQAAKVNNSLRQWTLEIDGSSNSKGSRLGIVLTSSEGDVMERVVRCAFKTTNNEVEYKAMIVGLSLAKELKVEDLLVKSDSQLIVSQISGDFQTKDSRMGAYLELTNELISCFKSIKISHITREENTHADVLANLGSLVESSATRTIPVITGQWPAIWGEKRQALEELHPIEEETWMTLIQNYITENERSENKNEARRLVAKAARFAMIS